MIKNKKNGFSVLEILVVIALLSVLGIITYIVLNPNVEEIERRNNDRRTDLIQILNAISLYENNNKEHPLSDVIPECDEKEIELGNGDKNLDLKPLVSGYLYSFPYDPDKGDEEQSGYTICREGSSDYKMRAKYAENGEIVETRK